MADTTILTGITSQSCYDFPMTIESEQALEALRTVWQGQPSLAPDLDEDCNPNKSCRNMKEVTFDGFAEPGQDLSTAWREKLAREGKLNTSGGSIRDLILGS